ncbi:unnamed protein product [Parajaminaea phylloscopi]
MTQPASSTSQFLASHSDFTGRAASLPSLYSSLSSLQKSNPTAYASNVEWWRQTLCDLVWQGAQPSSAATTAKGKGKEDRLVLHLNESLIDAFTLQDVGRPMGIGTVILDLEKRADVVDLQRYLSQTTPFAGPSRLGATSSRTSYIPSARSVAAFVLGKPLTYALGALGLTSSDDEDADEMAEWKRAQGDWVCWQNLEAAGSTVLSAHFARSTSPLDCLFTLATFRDLVSSALPHLQSDVDLRVLLKYLCRDRGLAVTQDGIVKLARSEGEVGAVKQLSQDDKALVAVKETHAKLEKQIQQIEERIRDRESALTQAIRTKQPQKMSLHLLRSKRELTELLQRRLDSKAQLDTILLKIEQSASDIEILDAYEASTGVLRNLTAKSGGVERVESVMSKLEDAMADQAEVDGAMREGNEAVHRTTRTAAELEEDERELQEEMARLEEEEQREREEAEEKRRLAEEAQARERQERKERKEREEKARRGEDKALRTDREERSKAKTETAPAAGDAPETSIEDAAEKRPTAVAVVED